MRRLEREGEEVPGRHTFVKEHLSFGGYGGLLRGQAREGRAPCK